MTRPVRVLELRSVRGTGGGPEKTILHGAALCDPRRCETVICYLRDRRDSVYRIDETAAALGVRYTEILERHSFDPSVWPRLRQLVRSEAIDLVHAHDYKTDLLALALAHTQGVAALATAHGWTGDSWKERWIYYPADRRLLARFPHVIAVSSQIRRVLLRNGASPRRVEVVLNAIDPTLFRRDPALVPEVRAELGVADGETVIGAVGRLELQKRFDLLLRAFAAVRRHFPGLRLVIAGEGSRRPELERQIAHLGLEGHARLLGHVADVRRLYHGFDLLAQSSDYEGTPNVILEAMALEVPIVATAAGGTAELARDGEHAWIVRPGNAGRIARALSQALSTPEEACRRARAARRRIEQDLSFQARTERLVQIYEKLVPPAARRRAD